MVALRVAYALAGAVLCLAALIVHRHVWRVLGMELPWGLVLALVASFLAVRAAGLLDGTAAGAVCCAAGWTAVLLYLFGGRTEGDYLLAADGLGYGLILGGLIAVGAGVFLTLGGPRADRTPASSSI